MSEHDLKTKWHASSDEQSLRNDFFDLFKSCPIPENELLSNLSLFTKRHNLAEILFMDQLYQRFVNVHGVIMEFGVRWGRNLALLSALRGTYEPFNHNRKIIGFDTFEGFPSLHEKDGDSDISKLGGFSVTKNYEKYLDKILNYHEQESPIPHIKKYELVKGDATVQIKKYLKDYPETIVAFAYFDLDLYEPTKKCLELISSHLTKGSVIGFDQLNFYDHPGETLALKEVFGLENIRLTRSPNNPVQSYFVLE